LREDIFMRSPWLWLVCVLVCGVLPARAVTIIDLPGDGLDTEFDLTWTVAVDRAPAGALVLGVESTGEGRGYTLRLEKGTAVWQAPGGKAPVTLGQGPAALTAGKRTVFSLKRRAGTMALLQDHRLVCAVAAPNQEGTTGTLAFRTVPAGLTIPDARYLPIERLHLGDDFMRDNKENGPRANSSTWKDDPTWKTAFFLKDDPGKDAKLTATPNPWQISLYQATVNSTNGFWYMYRGVGPSWTVADPTRAYPTWDRYFVQAAVRPEYDSQVGLIAAYQDNKNYLLFRWKSKAAGATTPRGELIAMIDGTPRTLATSSVGFAPAQWYTLRINLGWGMAQALVDGQVLMEARNPGAIEGRVGLYADGSANPRRPKVDDVTAGMYVTTDDKTGHTVNDAADAMRTSSIVFFDDVQVGSWIALENLFASYYPVDGSGQWANNGQGMRAPRGGRLVSGLPEWSLYTARTQVQIGAGGSASVLFHLDGAGNGYQWTLTPQGQRLQTLVKYAPKTEVARSTATVKPGTWADLRIEADGPYVALYCNGQRTLDVFDPNHAAGRCGIAAEKGNTAFGAFSLTLGEKHRRRLEVHKDFDTNPWMATWASAAADWYPVTLPASIGAYFTPAGEPHTKVGFAAPLPTDKPGLYWNKGGYYHDIRLIIPVSTTNLSGQIVHLSDNYNPTAMYRLELKPGTEANSGSASLTRVEAKVGSYLYRITPKCQLVFERRGDYLLLTAQELDPDPSIAADEPVVLSEQVVFAYRDPQPLPATQVGFTVTTPLLSAQKVIVESDRIQDAFERGPVGWITGSGIWSVMNRYSCDPKWNWYGGFGRHTPHIWNKTRLDGDQTVEVYMGIKMQFEDMSEEYGRRYRDMNVSICTDGVHLNSGYALVRAGRPNGRVVTLLFRKNDVVAQSTQQEHLLPPQGQGHRQWPAMRLEKRGGEVKVFLDNKLALTYKDPEPLPGGYVAFWTLDNGIMLGRANLSAQTMTTGTPHAAEPLALQEEFPAQAVPSLTVNGTPIVISTLERDLDGWKDRAGIGGRLLRVRETDPQRGTNTYLKVINAYPAGDFAVNAPAGVNLDKQPLLAVDYNFDPGVKVNCYAKVQGTWYEILLTAAEAQEANVEAAGRAPATADGAWHHLEINLAEKISAALKADGKSLADLTLQELVFADWHPTSDSRWYGFGDNSGGAVIRFDNLTYLPATVNTVGWSGPDAAAAWRTALDSAPWAVPAGDTTDRSLTISAGPARTLHLQAKGVDGKWGAVINLPIPAKK
jgi:hypothetical protein